MQEAGVSKFWVLSFAAWALIISISHYRQALLAEEIRRQVSALETCIASKSFIENQSITGSPWVTFSCGAGYWPVDVSGTSSVQCVKVDK